MSNPIELPALDFRKKITNQFHLRQIHILADQWAISPCEVCWRLITNGIASEKLCRQVSNEVNKVLNNDIPDPKHNPPAEKE